MDDKFIIVLPRRHPRPWGETDHACGINLPAVRSCVQTLADAAKLHVCLLRQGWTGCFSILFDAVGNLAQGSHGR